MSDVPARAAGPRTAYTDTLDASHPPLSDEQATAVRARAPLVALSAGAGSGKTTVLVERFIDLVHRDGVSPLAILAITFTDKAAAEMKRRIVRRFEQRGDESNRRQAEAAYISTIHGFCARLLREHPLAARLDPAFQVMDDLTRSIFLDEQLEALYASDDWYIEHEGRFANRFKASHPRLFELIVDAALRSAEFGTLGSSEESYAVEEHVLAAVRRVEEYWNGQWSVASGALVAAEPLIRDVTVSGPASTAQHAEMCELIARLRSGAGRDRDVAERICGCTGFTRGVKDKGAAGEIRAALDVARPVFAACAKLDLGDVARAERELFAPLKAEIYARARVLRDAYADFKRRHGLLDFEDLQSRALALLEDDAIRRECAGRFAHILLDEAQDTNAVQMRIVECLVDGRQSVFAVGDVKQAIYGFRGADVALFQEVWRRANGAGLSLADSYRSRAEVIAAVNETGERLWRDGSLDFAPLRPKFGYEEHATGPRVELRIVEQRKVAGEDGKTRNEPLDDVREREAIAMAAWIREIVDGETAAPMLVYDADEPSRYRRVRYGDVAILTRSRTPVPAFERALADFGIPFVKDGGRGFFAGRSVQDVLAALRVIANPLDDVSLLAALRSPLFGWGDEDLVRVRQAAGSRPLWYGFASGIEPCSATAARDALSQILRLRRWASLVPPAALIEMVCDATAYRAALLSLPRGRSQVANIDKLTEFARTAATLDGPSLASFIHRAELAERYLGAEIDAPIASADEDVVVLSTIHGAKGLEWPVVILPALDGEFVRPDTGSQYLAAEGALVLQPRDDEGETRKSAASTPLLDRAREREEAEARRLLYVAMTRAREYLVMSGAYAYPERRSRRNGLGAPLDWLASELEIAAPEPEARRMAYGGTELSVDFISPERVAPLRDETANRRDAELAAARRLVRDGRPVKWAGVDAAATESPVERLLDGGAPPWGARRTLAMVTVTQLVYFFRCPLVYWFDLVLQIEEHPRARGKAAARVGTAERRLTALDRGTAVHALLERADLAAEPNAEAGRLAAAVDELGGLDNLDAAERTRIAAMLASVLGDPLIDRARQATRLEREYPFYLDLGGTTVQGVIDLVFADADGRGVVVDFKSNDLAAPDRLRTLSALYRPQVELYALAAKRAGLVEPEETTLYFLNRAQAVTTRMDAARLDAVEAEAIDAVARIARAAWDTEPGEKCRSCGYRKRGYCEVGKRFRE